MTGLLTAAQVTDLTRFKHLWVGFSGGLDSTVLLHVLTNQPALSAKLTAVHINHQLSEHASYWAEHCQQQCQALHIPLMIRHVTLANASNIEESARLARLDIFCSLLKDNDCLLLGHHLDDQAETVLLQLCRGAGVDGLAAMPVARALGRGQVRRLLLHHPRSVLEHYAQVHDLTWIDDDSNTNQRFSRNYLRHHLLPSLQTRWPGVAGNLARTAHHCQQAALLLDDLAVLDCPAILVQSKVLDVACLQQLSHARLNNVLRVWLKKNAIVLPDTATFNRFISEVIKADIDAMPIVSWGKYCLRRYQHCLYLDEKAASDHLTTEDVVWSSFPNMLSLGEHRGQLRAIGAANGLVIPLNSTVRVRFRLGGEQLRWHGQTKTLKKLWQAWRIPPWLRDAIPLVFIDEQLAAVVGLAVSDLFYQESAGSGVTCYQLVYE